MSATNPPIFTAIENNNIAEVNNLIEQGKVNLKQKYGQKQTTALYYAVQKKTTTNNNNNTNNTNTANKMIVYLIAKGANVNAQNAAGITPLMYAALHGDLVKSAILLRLGANSNVRDQKGLTALYYAVFSKNNTTNKYEIVQMLLDFGANPNLLYDNNETILIQMMKNRSSWWNSYKYEDALVNLLLENGANVNLADITGNTAFNYAQKTGKSSAIINQLTPVHRGQPPYLRAPPYLGASPYSRASPYLGASPYLRAGNKSIKKRKEMSFEKKHGKTRRNKI
jgi:ankyrin repeat protein